MVRAKSLLDILVYASALLGFLPLFPYLDTVARLVFPAALVGGIVADRMGRELRGIVPTLVSLAFFFFYAVQFSRENFVAPAANLLVALIAVRLASEKNPRHYLQILALSLFALATSSLFNLSAVFLAYLFLITMLTGIALVILTFYTYDNATLFSAPGLKKVLAVAAILPAASLILMFVFFLILPRTQYPLWNFLNGATVQTTGFSERVSPGKAAAVSEEKSVAFRAASPLLAKDSLYWRGIVLNSYESSTWVRRTPPPSEEGRPASGARVAQTIYPEPGRSRYLLALDLPLRISGVRLTMAPDGVATRLSTSVRRSTYETVSTLSDTLLAPRGIDRAFYLAVPRNISPRLRALGREAAARESDAEKARYLHDYFQARRFTYATSDLPVSADPLDEFVFAKKRGNCEFFASSVALLLRVAGVPTRLVGGYYGGTYSELARYYVVTEDMAHVWVEAYLDGRGWVRVDPSGWAANADLLRKRGRGGLFGRLQLSFDAMSFYWNRTVINYDLDRQLQMFNQANMKLRRFSLPASLWRRSAPFLLLVLLPALLIILRRRSRVTPEEKLLAEFLRCLERAGEPPLPSGGGLYDLAAASGRPEIRRFVALYGGAVYRDRRLSVEEISELKRLIRSLGDSRRH